MFHRDLLNHVPYNNYKQANLRMPHKRKAAAKAPAASKAAAAKAPAASKAKKAKAAAAAKEEEEVAEGGMKDKIAQLKAADKGKVKKHKPDQYAGIASSSEVHEDYDAMLNQTNIGHNNNKFYIIQVLKSGSNYYIWNRWGRVGEVGENAMKGPFSSAEPATKDFEKKFRDKTRNKWEDREKFASVPGKYTLLEMAGDEDEEEEMDHVDAEPAKDVKRPVKACSLDGPTENLIKLIFDNDMFKEALQSFDIDVKKMPLGKLSKTQIAKGFEALEEIEKAIEKGETHELNELTSRFYTIIPHNFGRTTPPAIRSAETVQQKYDMLAVLGDIELAQSLQKEKGAKGKSETAGKDPHPLDVNYERLKCELNHLGSKTQEYKTLDKYFQNTQRSGSLKLSNIWSVDRANEGKRFSVNDKIDNRKLLWHGTNVAVVTAILKTGLRIMPHSGGRVGRGIYFASEHDKSAGYAGSAQNKVVMFLCEVAFGKENRITSDDSSLRSAPYGFDSVLACGQQEPEEKLDTTIKLDGKTITVPQGKPKPKSEYSSSSFWQSEYLIYREDQCRIRYLLLFSA